MTKLYPRSTPLSDGLRSLANWLDAHPEVPRPSQHTVDQYLWDSDIFDGMDMIQTMAQIAKSMGSCNKSSSNGIFTLNKTFGTVTLRIADISKQVCEKVVTGKRHVEAQEAYEVEDIEWKCPDSILAHLPKA
jgi:hypothetical protein